MNKVHKSICNKTLEEIASEIMTLPKDKREALYQILKMKQLAESITFRLPTEEEKESNEENY